MIVLNFRCLLIVDYIWIKIFLSVFGFQGTTTSHTDLYEMNGDGEIRTLDPLLARQVLSQLSYTPIWYSDLINSLD